MSRRAGIGIAAAVLMVVALTLRTAMRGLVTASPAAIPPDYRDGAPSLWVFVRSGCPHCDRHLEGLGRSLATLDPARRRVALARLRVVGNHPGVPPAARRLQAPSSGSLQVRVHPTTWSVDAAGRIDSCWLGARDAPTWERAISRIVTSEGP